MIELKRNQCHRIVPMNSQSPTTVTRSFSQAMHNPIDPVDKHRIQVEDCIMLRTEPETIGVHLWRDVCNTVHSVGRANLCSHSGATTSAPQNDYNLGGTGAVKNRIPFELCGVNVAISSDSQHAHRHKTIKSHQTYSIFGELFGKLYAIRYGVLRDFFARHPGLLLPWLWPACARMFSVADAFKLMLLCEPSGFVCALFHTRMHPTHTHYLREHYRQLFRTARRRSERSSFSCRVVFSKTLTVVIPNSISALFPVTLAICRFCAQVLGRLTVCVGASAGARACRCTIKRLPQHFFMRPSIAYSRQFAPPKR